MRLTQENSRRNTARPDGAVCGAAQGLQRVQQATRFGSGVAFCCNAAGIALTVPDSARCSPAPSSKVCKAS